MSKFEKLVTVLLIVLAAELGAVVWMAARVVNGVTVEVVEGE